MGRRVTGTTRVRLAAVLILSAVVVACTSQSATSAPDPATVLQAIPPADAARYKRVQNMKNWRNPYLIVRPDGVALLDAADNAEIILKTDELLGALAQLPASDWPYGRVVAVTENGTRVAEQDGVAIRRNKGIVSGLLEGVHIAIDWVPAA